MSKIGTRRTFAAAIGRWRLLGLFVLALLSLPSAPAAADDGLRLRVMTQHLYVGSFFQELNAAVAAGTPAAIIAAATLTYQRILETKPAERAVVLADKIAELRPDFVGLEQAAILRTGTLNPPPASTVTFDLLQSLLERLAAKGVRYEAVAVKPGVDAEVPTALGFNARI